MRASAGNRFWGVTDFGGIDHGYWTWDASRILEAEARFGGATEPRGGIGCRVDVACVLRVLGRKGIHLKEVHLLPIF